MANGINQSLLQVQYLGFYFFKLRQLLLHYGIKFYPLVLYILETLPVRFALVQCNL